MTSEALRMLIEDGENLLVEFKGEEHAPLNDRDLVETVVCLANQQGASFCQSPPILLTISR